MPCAADFGSQFEEPEPPEGPEPPEDPEPPPEDPEPPPEEPEVFGEVELFDDLKPEDAFRLTDGALPRWLLVPDRVPFGVPWPVGLPP